MYSQSELLQKEVFLVELVDSIYKSKESMSHLKAVYFLRPSSENIQHLRRQLANPRFGEYHLCEFFKFVLCVCARVCVDTRARICICFSKCYPLFEVPIWLCPAFYSFLQHVEGHTDSYFSWFRWAGSCAASSGKTSSTNIVMLDLDFLLPFSLVLVSSQVIIIIINF